MNPSHYHSGLSGGEIRHNEIRLDNNIFMSLKKGTNYLQLVPFDCGDH